MGWMILVKTIVLIVWTAVASFVALVIFIMALLEHPELEEQLAEELESIRESHRYGEDDDDKWNGVNRHGGYGGRMA